MIISSYEDFGKCLIFHKALLVENKAKYISGFDLKYISASGETMCYHTEYPEEFYQTAQPINWKPEA